MQLRGRGGLGAVALTAVAIALSGCVSAPPQPTPTQTPSPSYVSDYVPPAPIVYAPLTGLPVDDPATVERPSLAAKIDNHVDARPQLALDSTDLVFEELVEGGLTRYVGVWHSRLPKELGPIRSIRPMDPDIISPFGGIVAYSGGQYRFVVLMQQTNVYNAIHGQRDTADVMFRTPSKPAPHNVIVRAQTLVKRNAELAPPKQQFSFADSPESTTAVREGSRVRGVRLVFGAPSHPSWSWNAESGRWRRSQNGAADKDAKGKQLSAANVIVIRVGVGIVGGVPKTQLIGRGEALVLSGGSAVKATWSKGSRTAAIRLVDKTGAVIRLAPGNSWIELVPNSGSVSLVRAG